MLLRVFRLLIVAFTTSLIAFAIYAHFYDILLSFGQVAINFDSESIWGGVYRSGSSQWYSSVMAGPCTSLKWSPSILHDRFGTVAIIPWWMPVAAWLAVAIPLRVWTSEKRNKPTAFPVEVSSKSAGA